MERGRRLQPSARDARIRPCHNKLQPCGKLYIYVHYEICFSPRPVPSVANFSYTTLVLYGGLGEERDSNITLGCLLLYR